MLRFCLRSIYSIQGYFRPSYFLHLQTVSPSSKFAQAHLCMKEKIWDLRIRPVRAKVAKIKHEICESGNVKFSITMRSLLYQTIPDKISTN